jgi:hypothetical protein
VSTVGLIFVGLFVAGVGLSLFRHAVFGVATYVVVLFVSPADRWWSTGFIGETRWAFLAAGVTLLSLLLHRPQRHEVPIWRQGFLLTMAVFVGWLYLQSFWALDPKSHAEFAGYYFKYLIAVILIYLALDTPQHVRVFMWAYLAGCTYLAWVSMALFSGGRFDNFGGAGINDANTGGLVMVTGILVAVSLFLAEKGWLRLVPVLSGPLLVNALVSTESRSAFLALLIGGGVYALLSNRRARKWMLVIAIGGLALLAALSNAAYWGRIGTITHLGEQVDGVDTGHKRLILIEAQLQMAQGRPMGCGSRCTDVLSPRYLDEKQLAGKRDETKARSSHNTTMTMLVDHGWPGVALYFVFILWAYRRIRAMQLEDRSETPGVLWEYLPAVAGVLVATFVADQFVQMPKLEPRLWFATVLMVMLSLRVPDRQQRPAAVSPRSTVHAHEA